MSAPFRYSSPPEPGNIQDGHIACSECDSECARLVDGECCDCRDITSPCDSCSSERDRQAERAYERQVENYYGGSQPVTLDEKHAQAWKNKQR